MFNSGLPTPMGLFIVFLYPTSVGPKKLEIKAGYSTDDDFLRILVLIKCIINAWPTSSSLSTALHDATQVWNSPGLLSRQYLSSALVLPDTTAANQEHTNAVYYQLLECLHFIDNKPLVSITPDQAITPFVHVMSSAKMIFGV
jgi:hypothetical protein